MKKFFIFIFMLIFHINYCHSLEIKDNKIVDKSGYQIEKKEYKKIIITDPAIVEIIYALGAEDNIAAIANATMSQIHPHEKTSKLPSIGTLRQPSLEKIVELKPDLVITFSGTSSITPELVKFDIPVLTTAAGSIDQIYKNIEICGYLVGKEKEAQELITQCRIRVQKHRNQNKGKKTLKGIVLFSLSPMMTFSDDTLPGEILQILGVENLGMKSKDKSSNPAMGVSTPILSNEFIIMEDPDFIAATHGITDIEDMKKALIPIADTRAIQKNNLFFLDPQKMVRGSHRIFDSIDEIAEKLSKLNLEDTKEEDKK